jgi:hypothetical protein
MKMTQGGGMLLRSVLSLVLFLSAATAFAQQTVAISQPPASVMTGTPLSITDTVWNPGTSPSGSLTQNLMLVSANGPIVVNLGTRLVPGLQGGAVSTATTILTVPANVPPGSYKIAAGSPNCNGNCLKSLGTVNILGNSGTVSLSMSVMGAGTVTGNLQNLSGPTMNCSANAIGGLGCSLSGPSGTTFVLTANPGTIPGNPPFGQSHQATFAGWSGQGCSGQVQGNQIRITANSNVMCSAKFQ